MSQTLPKLLHSLPQKLEPKLLLQTLQKKFQERQKTKQYDLASLKQKSSEHLNVFKTTGLKTEKKLSSRYYRVYSWAHNLEFARRYPQHA